VSFFNECMVFIYFRLKEYQNAKILAQEILDKLSKQVLFSVGDSE